MVLRQESRMPEAESTHSSAQPSLPLPLLLLLPPAPPPFPKHTHKRAFCFGECTLALKSLSAPSSPL